MGRKKNAHRKALEKIAANPGKFGFKNIVYLSLEPDIYSGRRRLKRPDIFMQTSTGEIHLVEYKGNGDEDLLEKAREQLEAAVWWFGKYRPEIDQDSIHTHIISGTDPKYKDLFR